MIPSEEQVDLAIAAFDESWRKRPDITVKNFEEARRDAMRSALGSLLKGKRHMTDLKETLHQVIWSAHREAAKKAEIGSDAWCDDIANAVAASLQTPQGDIGELIEELLEYADHKHSVARLYPPDLAGLAEANNRAAELVKQAAQALQALEQRAQKAESERDEAKSTASKMAVLAFRHATTIMRMTKEAEAAEQKVKELITSLDLPPERDRTDEQRKDIQRAWDLIQHLRPGHLLDSTEGHLALVRAIQLGRRLASHSTVEQMAKALEEMPRSLEIATARAKEIRDSKPVKSFDREWWSGSVHAHQDITTSVTNWCRSALSLKKDNAHG